MSSTKPWNPTMLCDFYELTMANGYFRKGYQDKITYFDVFFRKVPDEGGFAIAAGLSPATDAIFLEPADSVSGKIFTNYVVVRPEDTEADWVTALASCLQSDKVKEYMLNSEKYAGGVIPAF